MDGTKHHVICALKNNSFHVADRKKYTQKIHEATYDINVACKKLYTHGIEINEHYPHRRDTVFIVHINHNFNSWTIFKPSFIEFKSFVKLAQKIYRKHGLEVLCNHDALVTITNSDENSPGVKSLTLDQFEKYKKLSDQEIDEKLQNPQDHEYEHYKKVKRIKDFFFWHLQIPTTGLMQSDRFDLADEYKPLAWHFLLWDLAPKKGKGACVAIIDTGASAFNVPEKEFASLYKKNINIDAANILQDYGYNLVSKDGLDPIRQIMINLANFCDHKKFNSNDCMEKLPEIIIDVVKNKNKIQFEQYFTKYAKNRYLASDSKILNQEGEIVLKDLLYGKYGIAPLDQDPFFHITQLQAPYNELAIIETLPTPKLTDSGDAFSAGHGTFTQGVVNGKLHEGLGITGLAPQAQVTMIKAFNDRGTTNKTTLNAALERAINLKNPIVSMSLKITDEIDTKKDAHLKELIDSIDYVVAASGNDGQLKKLKNKEAYPAKFDSVAFDVGAFSYDDGQYPVCPFTQIELNVGPKFVAPGSNLFSSGLTPGQKDDSMYVFMSGTSIAVPVITGFMALVLAEFEDVFTRDQILKVIYAFSIKLGDDATWQKYIKLGTPDMRSSLLALHVLHVLEKALKENLQFSFKENFDNLVKAVWLMNYYVPNRYEKEIGTSLTGNLAGFSNVVQEKKPDTSDFHFYVPVKNDLAGCIDFISSSILHAIDHKKYDCPQDLSGHEKLLTSLQNIVTAKKYNVFAQLPAVAQTRIQGALKERISCMISE
jgi:subtilisin family serine protease